MGTYDPGALKEYANAQAAQYGIPSDVFSNLIETESGWNPNAVSPAGAEGIAQLMPETSAGHVDPFDPFASMQYAAQMLSGYFKKFGDWSTALAAYNAGPGNVTKYGGVPPFAETQNYIKKILGQDVTASDFSATGERGSTMSGTLWKVALWGAAIVLVIYALRAMLK
jgi:soluble lytic murein transglycosylase-like protein